MDVAVALPLHFTLEVVVLSAAGLVLAWALLRRRFLAAGASAAMVVVQTLHAGQFVKEDDAVLIVVLRLVAVAALAIDVLPIEIGRRLFAGSLAAIGAGAVWGAVAGGGSEDPSVPAHVLMAGGATALLVWVWQASRPSVRLRVLSAFISVLAVTVIVAGGAVARVAATNSRTSEQQLLTVPAAALHNGALKLSGRVLSKAAKISPSVTADLEKSGKTPTTRLARLAGRGVIAAEIDKSGHIRATLTPSLTTSADITTRLNTFQAVRNALDGRSSTSFHQSKDSLVVVGAAPVYKRGSKGTPADVIGAVLIGIIEPVSTLEDSVNATIPGAQVRISEQAGTATANSIRFVEVNSSMGRRSAAVVPLGSGPAFLVVVAPPGAVAESAADLVRAFLVAILAAALLAVVAGLWLSARIARPMLDLADEAERAKVDFLSTVSHELRTPLTPIRGYADILRRGRVPARDQGEYLDEIGLAAQKLERIVTLLLDVAAIEAGRFLVNASDVSVPELFADIKEHWESRARKHKLEVRVPRSLPNVQADPQAIERVLDELVDNAIKFSPGGTIELRAKRTGDAIEFSVRDEGPGIDPERVAALREAFKQADTGDTRRYGGLGLGLAFAEGVLAAHGSTLEIEGVPGSGTTCSFTLPATGSVTRMSAPSAVRSGRTR